MKLKRRIWRCSCGRIAIKNYVKYLPSPICICDSITFMELSEKELRKLKLDEIQKR